MTRLIPLFALGAALAAFFVGQASAKPTSHLSSRVLSDARMGHSKAEVRAQIKYSTNVIEAIKSRGLWRIAPRHKTCWSHVPWAKLCDHVRSRYLLHQQLLQKATSYWQAHYAVFTPGIAIPAWLSADFDCIHRYEGAWNANTGNGYYGGLQMDLGFQSRYGPEFARQWGTADNWPVWAQKVAAVRAYQSGRGFYPWPNTAHVCGLI